MTTPSTEAAIAEASPPQITTIDTRGAIAAPAMAPVEAVPAPAASEALPSAEVVKSAPTLILVIDIGGTKVKILATGQTEPRKAPTGKDFTPSRLVETVRTLAEGWEYEAIAIGYPGLVGSHGPRSEPGNLGAGWVGFDFAAAFGMPVKMVNDAAMQALGSYEGGRMLFLGLGTGLGSALVSEDVVVPLELAHLPYREGRTYEEYVGQAGLDRLGKDKWRTHVARVVELLSTAVVADYTVLGGGNVRMIPRLPPRTRRGSNANAFRGGYRVWEHAWSWA